VFHWWNETVFQYFSALFLLIFEGMKLFFVGMKHMGLGIFRNFAASSSSIL